MTIVLPAVPAAPPDVVADPATIDAFGRDLGLASGQLDDVGSWGATPQARMGSWRSPAADDYRGRATTLVERTDALSLALRGVGRRVREHADRMTDLLRERGLLVGRRTSLADRIDALAGSTLTADEVAGAEAEASALRRQASEYDADLDDWLRTLRSEESQMAAELRALTALDRVLERYAGQADPADAARRRLTADDDPAAVADWWRGLTDEERTALLHADPELLGNLDGLPAGVRDEANRTVLARDLAHLEDLAERGLLTREEQRHLDNARSAAQALAQADSHLGIDGLPVGGQLYLYDPRDFGGDGRIAISLGDLDSADNVSVSVPGFSSTLQSAGHNLDQVANLHDAAAFLDPDSSTATLMWIGYDAPNTDLAEGWRVAGETRAREGGALLADTLDGLRASREDRAALTVIGHSYGSTTTGFALSQHDVDVDRAIIIGSPGLGRDVSSVDDLNVPEGEVYVGRNSRDAVADLSWNGNVNLGTAGLGLGRDPSEDRFGAERFQAESVRRDDVSRWNDLDRLQHAWSRMHTAYYDHDSESLANMARIVTGQIDQVSFAEPVDDPWWRGPRDPEHDAPVETPRTRP